MERIITPLGHFDLNPLPCHRLHVPPDALTYQFLRIGDFLVAIWSTYLKIQKLNFFFFTFFPSFSPFSKFVDAQMKCSVISSVCRSKYQNRVKIGKVMTKSKISATVKWTDFSAVLWDLSFGPNWAQIGPKLGRTGTVFKTKIRRLLNFLRNFSIFFSDFFAKGLSIISAIKRCLVPFCEICR